MTGACCADQVINRFMSVLSASVRFQSEIDHLDCATAGAATEHEVLSESARYYVTLIEMAAQHVGRK